MKQETLKLHEKTPFQGGKPNNLSLWNHVNLRHKIHIKNDKQDKKNNSPSRSQVDPPKKLLEISFIGLFKVSFFDRNFLTFPYKLFTKKPF